MKSKKLLSALLTAIIAVSGFHTAAEVMYIVPNGTGSGTSWEDGANISALAKKSRRRSMDQRG